MTENTISFRPRSMMTKRGGFTWSRARLPFIFIDNLIGPSRTFGSKCLSDAFGLAPYSRVISLYLTVLKGSYDNSELLG